MQVVQAENEPFECGFGVSFRKFFVVTFHGKGIDNGSAKANPIQDREPPTTCE